MLWNKEPRAALSRAEAFSVIVRVSRSVKHSCRGPRAAVEPHSVTSAIE